MKRTDQHIGGANNHSPSCTRADTQLNTLKGPDYQASKVRPYKLLDDPYVKINTGLA